MALGGALGCGLGARAWSGFVARDAAARCVGGRDAAARCVGGVVSGSFSRRLPFLAFA